MKQKVISATDFKAKCLGLLDQVAADGKPIVITKRGKAIATLSPISGDDWESLEGILKGEVVIEGDIVNTNFAELWDAAKGR